jgi:hypothetical protein
MMLAYRLVRLIETHSEQLAKGLFDKLKTCDKCKNFARVPSDELQQRVNEVYHHLGEWLLGRTESEVERRYRAIGERRAHQGVPLSELIWIISLMKENLIDFLQHETIEDKPVEVFGELEILKLLEQFFDRASYYAALGHEHACVAQAGGMNKGQAA